jgi:hypothetical protein
MLFPRDFPGIFLRRLPAPLMSRRRLKHFHPEWNCAFASADRDLG